MRLAASLTAFVLFLGISSSHAEDKFDVKGGFFDRDKKEFFDPEEEAHKEPAEIQLEPPSAEPDDSFEVTAPADEKPVKKRTPKEMLEDGAAKVEERISNVLQQMRKQRAYGNRPDETKETSTTNEAVERKTGSKRPRRSLDDARESISMMNIERQEHPVGLSLILNAKPEAKAVATMKRLKRLAAQHELPIKQVVVVGFQDLWFDIAEDPPKVRSTSSSWSDNPKTAREYEKFLAEASQEQFEKFAEIDFESDIERDFKSMDRSQIERKYGKLSDKNMARFVAKNSSLDSLRRMKLASEFPVEKEHKIITSREDFFSIAPQVEKELSHLGLKEQSTMALEDLEATIQGVRSPTWIVHAKGKDFLHIGTDDISRNFSRDGQYSEVEQNFENVRKKKINLTSSIREQVIVSRENRGDKLVEPERHKKFASVEASVFTEPATLPTAKHLALAELPRCGSSQVRSTPVGSLSGGTFNVLFYDGRRSSSSRRAQTFRGHSVPYSPMTRQELAKSKAPLLRFAKSLDLRCLPTTFRLREEAGQRFLEYAEGEEAWR